MSTRSTLNLDRLAARGAQAVIRRTLEQGSGDVENTVTKALGVLQENGIYACVLFLKSRPKAEKPRADVVVDEILSLLDSLGFGPPAARDADSVLTFISGTVAADLDRLLLAKETVEQMLIYARYGAKARET